MKELALSLRETLAFFSLFNQPLTREELFFNLWRPPAIGYEDFVRYVAGESDLWKNRDNFYFLSGREADVCRRRERVWVNDRKLALAVKAAKKLRYAPFVRAVAVCNSVGFGQADEESDIDFLVFTAKGRLWTARFFSNLFLRLTGWRVRGKNRKNKICLSFFMDENNFCLKNLRVREDDVYLIYWLTHLIPLYDSQGWFLKFWQKNSWVKKFTPYAATEIFFGNLLEVTDNFLSRGWRKFWEIAWGGAYGAILEKQFAAAQRLRLKGYLSGKNYGEKDVVISEGMFKLHQNDRRRDYYDRWRDIAEKYAV
jgi:hypothetical protein